MASALRGKTILLTGATGGIGQPLLRALAVEGARIRARGSWWRISHRLPTRRASPTRRRWAEPSTS
jgi:NAD(P)-dependent dehydrogenase (short-subunit alcohol dehydrogenase family)